MSVVALLIGMQGCIRKKPIAILYVLPDEYTGYFVIVKDSNGTV